MKAKVTITLVIEDLKKYVDDSEDLDKEALCEAFSTDLDEGNVSVDDLMVQDDVDINNIEVKEYAE